MHSIKIGVVALVVSVSALFATTTFAWGPEGHKAVALVAQQVLKTRSPQTLTALKPLLGNASLADVAVCPDELREHDREPNTFHYSPACQLVFGAGGPGKSDEWHFINLNVLAPVPTTDVALDQRFCVQGDCVVAKIVSFEQVLSTTKFTTSTGNRTALQALSFVVHFVGDIHQPLHAAERNSDAGGNGVHVLIVEKGRAGAQPEKLHGAWDGVFISNVAGDEVSFVSDITAFVNAALKEQVPPAAQFPAWVHNWARQSEKLAADHAYVDQGQSLPLSGHTLSSSYESDAEAIVKQQVAIAGVRLAAFLAEAMKGH